MSDQLLLALKAGFLVLLFLFVWRVVRISARDLAGPAPVAPAKRTSSRGDAPVAGSTASPRLVVLSSPVFPPATVVRLERDVVLGRADDCDVVLEGDGYASSRHTAVVAQGADRVLRDLGSTNGTHVGGREVAGDHLLVPGDVVRVGETEFRYEA